MTKKITILPLRIICFAFALVFLIISAQEASAGIDSSRAQIIALADEGKLTQVDETIDKLIADYNGTDELHSNLLIIADSFVWRRLYERTDRLYRFILENTNDSSLATRAHLGLRRVEILNLIGVKEYSAAQQKVDLMVGNFKDEPDLATALFQIGKELTWQQRYIEAKDAFDFLAENQPNNPASGEAKLWSARANVCSLIIDGKDEQALSAIDNLISDFEGDAGLPEAIYWISKQYEWKKSATEDRTGWYNAPNSIYQRLIQQFGNSSFGQDAEWDKKRLTHRMKIFKLMKEADHNEIDAAIEKMVTDLSGRPEVAGELIWIAWGYEELPGKTSQARQMYERIITEYPGSDEVKDAYFLAGVCYSQSKEYRKAIEMYKAVAANWPDYKFGWETRFLIGHHYQQLADAGDVPQTVAVAETKTAYQQLIKEYPGCPVNGLVRIWLKKHSED